MGTVIVGLGLLAVIGLIIYVLYKDKKAGKTSCGSGCSGCAMQGKCNKR